jgi:hypothetical protein
LFSSTEEDVQSALRVYIYLDRISFSNDEPVKLQICVKNNSNKSELLKIFDALYTTYQPIIYDESAKEAELIVPYRMMNKKMTDVLEKANPRTVELSRDETLEYTLNLREIYRLEADKEYRVEIRFSLDAKNQGYITGENIVTFKTFKSAVINMQSGIKRPGRDISPSETLLLFLNAEKSRNWDNYLKYLKLEDYIQAYPDYVSLYRNADEVKKTIIIDEFIKFLKKDRSDYIVDFNVSDELIKDNDIAYVDAEIKRYGPRMPFYYKYRYTLERYRSFWRITDVEATVLKGHNL